MKQEFKFIFDLDGTLYQFDKGKANCFTQSQFYADLKESVFSFLMDKGGLDRQSAEIEYERLKQAYKDEISLAVEQEYGIDRFKYFAQTWNLNPEAYIEENPELKRYCPRF